MSAWQFFAATGNVSWLAEVGFPILAGAADFALSRVSPPPPSSADLIPPSLLFSVRGVLPIDEWCVGSGCGCETPGVDDDAQMNGVTKASLLLVGCFGILSSASMVEGMRRCGARLLLSSPPQRTFRALPPSALIAGGGCGAPHRERRSARRSLGSRRQQRCGKSARSAGAGGAGGARRSSRNLPLSNATSSPLAPLSCPSICICPSILPPPLLISPSLLSQSSCSSTRAAAATTISLLHLPAPTAGAARTIPRATRCARRM